MFIYKITNIKNKKAYIGKTINIKNRFYKHKNNLRANRHDNKYLQWSWNKHGENNFIFEVMFSSENCTNEELNALEKQYIKEYKSNIRQFGYNMTEGGEGAPGIKLSKNTKKKISISILAKFKQYNLKECKIDALRFKSRVEWAKYCYKSYSTARKKGWLQKCCKHMIRSRRIWTLYLCHQEALKYKTRSDWIKNHLTSYQAAVRGKWLKTCCSHMIRTKKSVIYETLELCQREALKYKTRKDWRKCHITSYSVASRNKWINQCCTHMTEVKKPTGYWTLELCQQYALKYKTRTEWNTQHLASYQAARRQKWLDCCCSHMKKILNKP